MNVNFSYLNYDQLKMAKYETTNEILTILNLAHTLQKPILLEGPPGSGKTSIAIAVATALNYSLIRIQAYEGITAEQVIGEFDYKKQLLAIQIAQLKECSAEEIQRDIFAEDFFIKRPLLQAFASPKPTVLLIDEIDESDAEFEAFLLEALGENQITVPELGTIQKPAKELLVFLTSNASRDLSEPLRRRCLFLYLDFPDPLTERKILQLHCPDAEVKLLDLICQIIKEIRELDLRKIPSIAESIDWVRTLLTLGIQSIEKDYEPLLRSLNIVIKHKEDLEIVTKEFERIVRKLKTKEEDLNNLPIR